QSVIIPATESRKEPSRRVLRIRLWESAVWIPRSACHQFHAIWNATFSWMENTNGTALFEVCQQSFLRPGSGCTIRDRGLGANGFVSCHAASAFGQSSSQRPTKAVRSGRICETTLAFPQPDRTICGTLGTRPQPYEYSSPRSVAAEWQADAV